MVNQLTTCSFILLGVFRFPFFVFKVLGIMGALDPHMHKRSQRSSSGSHAEVTRGTSDPGQPIRSMEDLPLDLGPSFATSEDYYATVLYSQFK